MNTTVDEIVVWCDREEFHSKAASFIKPVSTVLDIGCGIRPQQYITPELLICVEPHLEYVEILKTSLKDASAVIIPLDAKRALAGMPDRSVDSIFLIDVIEHMDKIVGAEVLLECERVARQQVVIFTPLGFMPQEIHAGDVDGWNLHGGDWQDHKSGWYPEEFTGWNVVACKHLHLQDYLGEEITPPYGGFYAIKNVPKVANHFNDIYSNDVIESHTSNLPWLDELFPLLSEKVVRRDIDTSYLKCGIFSCQRTTELFIELGATENKEVIFSKAAAEKSDAMLRETRKHNERVRAFAEQFSQLNGLSVIASELDARATLLEAQASELDARAALVAAECDARVAVLDARASELDARAASVAAECDARIAVHDAQASELEARTEQLNARSSALDKLAEDVSGKEVDIIRRAQLLDEQEQAIHKSLCRKLSVKMRSFFK
jgi:hypothetical protein